MAQTINAGKIQYSVGFQVDKTGLNELKNQLNNLTNSIPSSSKLLKMDPSLKNLSEAGKKVHDIQKSIVEVEQAFNNAFNVDTGLMNLKKLNTSLKDIGINRLAQNFSYFGQQGQQAFYQITKSALTTEMQFKKTHGILDKMGQTLMNTLKWQISSSAINRFTGAVQQAYGYVQHLDTSLNDIRIVTGKSADEMERFARTANKAAKSLGASTTEYTEAALIYYQQGLSDEEANARAATTLKAANVTGQSGAAVSEELTAVWNGYKVSAEETELAVDKLAAVAATTAADLEELSVGMSKVASAANNMGVDMDQLNAMIATIVSITRQAPESVGTALKTIFARMSDLKLGDTDEDGLKLGDVSGSLEKVGISILDTNGDLREMGDVIEEVAGKWDTWTKAQQAAVAQSLAGKRQYNNLVALFDNWDMYSQAINTSRNSMGTLQKQQDIYMESTEAHLQVLHTQWEDLYDSLLDTDTINNLIDSLTKVIKLFTELIDSIGGGNNLFLMLGATATRVFNKQLGQGIVNFVTNLKKSKDNTEQLKAQLDTIEMFKNSSAYKNNPAVKALVDAQETASQYYKFMDNEQINQANMMAQQIGDAQALEEQWKESTKALKEYGDAVQNVKGSAQTGKGPVRTNDYDIVGNSPSERSKEAMGQRLRDSMSDIDNFEKRIKGLRSSYQNLYNDAEKLDNAINNKAKIKEIEQKEKKWLKSLDSLRRGGEGLQNQFELLNKTNLFPDLSSSQITSIETAFRKFNSVLMDDNSTLEDLDNAIIELQSQIETLPKSAQKAAESLIKIYEAGDQTGNFGVEERKKEQKAFLDSAEMQAMATSIVSVVGGLGQLASGISAVKNLGGIWNNDDLSTGEKILQTLTNVGMSLPMLVSGFTAIQSSFKTLQPLATKLFASIAAGLTADIHLTTIFKGLLDTLKSHPIILGMAAIAGTFGAITYFSNKYQKEQEQEAKADEEAAQKAREHTQAIEEQGKQIDEVISKYDELNEKIKNQEITTEGARNEIYNLCKQYGLQDLALKALIVDYEDLAGVLKEANAEQAKRKAESTSNERELSRVSAKSSIWKNLGSTARDDISWGSGRGIDLSGIGFLGLAGAYNEDRALLKSNLKDLGIKVDNSGHIDLQAFVDAYASNREELIKILESSDTEAATELLEIIETNKTQLEAYRESYQADLKAQATDRIINGPLNDIVERIDSGEAFNDAKTKLTEALSGVGGLFDSKEAAAEFVDNYLSGIDEIKDYAQQADLISALSGESGFSEKEIQDILDNHSDAEINFFKQNLALARKYKDDINQYFIDNQKAIERIGKQDTFVKIKTAFINSEGKEFKQEDIDEIFKDKVLTIKVAKEDSGEEEKIITQDSFENETFEQQRGDLLSYYLQKGELENEFQQQQKQNLIDLYDTQLGDLEKLEGTYNDVIDKAKEGTSLISNAFTDTSYFGTTLQKTITEDDLDLLYEYVTGEGELSTETQDFINSLSKENLALLNTNTTFQESIKANKKYRDGLKQAGIEYKKYEDVLKDFADQEKDLSSLKDSLEELGVSWAEFGEMVQGALSDTNKGIDNLQSAYSSLTSVMEEYNETGQLSMDNLQTFLNMDTAYLSALQIENGQMSLNEQALQQIALARLDEAEAEAYEQAMAELNDEARRREIEGIGTASQSLEMLGNAAVDAANAARSGIGAWQAYWAAALNKEGISNDAYAQQVGQALYVKLQAIDSVRQRILSGDLGGALGGSKSSSSSSEKEAKHEEYLEREYDIYRKINTELDQIGNKLDRIDEIESHSWGVSYLDTLQEENKLLDEQLEKLEEKKALQIGDLGQRKKQLENEGFTFDENGSLITNAEDRLDALYASYNTNYVDKYNSMSADAQEEFEAEMKAEEDRIKQIEDAVGDYEKLYSDYEDLIKELQDLYYKQIEKDVEEFNFEIDLELELSDARKEWKDFWHDVVKDVESDDFVGQIAKSFSKLGELIGVGGSSNNDVLGLTQHLKETLDEVNTQITTHGLDGLFGTDTKLSEENLTNYRDKLMSALKDAKEEIENISDNYLSMLESAQDMIDKQVEGWENIGDQINHNLELIKLISGENTYDALAKQYEQQYDNNLQTIEAQRIGRDYWKEKIAEYKTLLAAAEEGTEEYKTLQKALDTSTEKYIEANKELNSTVEESIKNLQEWRKNSVSAITEVLDKTMSGGLGTDMLEQEWKLINDYADQYFDNVERAVNMEEYTNVLQDAANATGLTAKNQEKINKFMDEELKKLNEKEKLTQYDIDESKARLEILKAEMALQNAQRNKSNMRLRRDNQGNYTYQYTGNEQAIEDAEKAGLTARKAWYELVKKRNKETNDYIIQLEKDRISIMNQLDEAELAGDEERANKLKELLNRNEEQIVFAYGEAQKTKQDLFSGTAQYFADVENAEILPMWDATVTQLVDRFAGDNKDSFITACKNAINELGIVQERYVEKTQRILNTAGIAYQKLVKEGIDPTKDAIEELNESNEDLADNLDDTNEKLEEMRSYLEECAQAYRDFKDDAVSAIQEANQALEILARTHMDTVNQINTTPITSLNGGNGFDSSYTANSGGSNSGGNGSGSSYTPTAETAPNNIFAQGLEIAARSHMNTVNQINRAEARPLITIEAGSGRLTNVTSDLGGYLNDLLGKGILDKTGSSYFVKNQQGVDLIKKKYRITNKGPAPDYNTVVKNFPIGPSTYVTLKSGGYTGDWSGQGIDGMGGRMAVLHQKELVLNESDTSNMLAAVEALRQMNIDKLAQSILATSIATAQMQIQTQLLSAQLSGLRDQYESSRNTTINADFSGVRTADEILRAFEELENYGLQQYNTGDASYRSY